MTFWRCVVTAALLMGAMRGSVGEAEDATWDFKEVFRQELIETIPDILASQDAETGRFGSGIWIVTDQNVLFPLAVAWASPGDRNPYHHRDDVLRAIIAGGDALIDDQDAQGKWEFRKKDGSTWGPIYMPWTYSRWIRAYGLIRDAMPPERDERWRIALTLGYEGISRTALGRVHNIPAHHAMGLYHAGQLLNRPEWCAQATAFMKKVSAEQDPGGYWSEHIGPVVGYNFVYTDALGTYFAMSADASVLPTLERAAEFHRAFTYPDGSRVETIDERNPYKTGVSLGNVGFTFSDSGRRFLQQQWRRLDEQNQSLSADAAASFVLYGKEGPLADDRTSDRFVLGDDDAVTQHRSPWFACLSAFHCDVPENRWIQDRQNLVSLFHERVGLIGGGGNTKLQPRWSSFIVGDSSLLFHRPGVTHPKFAPPLGIQHVPENVVLDPERMELRLTFADSLACRLAVDIRDPEKARLTYSCESAAGQTVVAHLTLLPHVGEAWETASGKSGVLSDTPLHLAGGDTGGAFGHHGWRVSVPRTGALLWPALPHNPYRRDGRAAVGEGRLVLLLPFDKDHAQHTIEVEVAP